MNESESTCGGARRAESHDSARWGERPRGADGPLPEIVSASDEGAGTVLGLILIIVATVMIVIAVGVGHLLVARSRAASAADLSSLSAANALWRGGEPCEVAAEVAAGHDATLVACEIGGDTGEDVTVRVGVDVGMPFLPDLVQSARAGPTYCE
ncbi:flp pilus-assembly TadE/G-like family protein [Bifidobacterium sp. MA2]|uniref:Flp pilus-assembly TadE/G-like family protein n=1 Tax=Bifidobacterium santillanense TaxID=2809028 RepID=A0ABS5UT34_9BIFI|nr:Rv3654c family TadE-like protein [Bifidobacterium santillanense]MBT1173728.1 flp pilus-assembly TadE/G-like family protein [Bifidobacterium santillanense]